MYVHSVFFAGLDPYHNILNIYSDVVIFTPADMIIFKVYSKLYLQNVVLL